MDTAEIVVYLGIAVIIGGFILIAVGRFDGERIYDKVQRMFSPPKVAAYTQVTNETVTPLLYRTWEECGLGTRDTSITFQYTTATPMTNESIFNIIKNLRLCNSFRSESNGCGNTEDLVMPKDAAGKATTLNEGRVYRVNCDAATKTMIIS